MRYKTRDLVYIALFGTIWGVAEMSLGALLHTLNVPQTGTIMTFFGITIMLVGYTFVPRRGAVLLIGGTTALLKMFSLGGIVINPMIAILMQAFLVEVALSLGRGKNLKNFVLAGALAEFWNIIHPFITQGILAGWGIIRVYLWLVNKGAELLGISSQYALLIFISLLLIRVIAGIFAGFIGWEVASAVKERLSLLGSEEQIKGGTK
jgi:hypothetical protein